MNLALLLFVIGAVLAALAAIWDNAPAPLLALAVGCIAAGLALQAHGG